MINVDGVIGGNFRTSFSGKDLNKEYGKNEKILCPEIQYILQLQKQNKYSAILDLHGHSSKKGIFVYGVGNQKIKRQFYEGRILATQMQTIQTKFIEKHLRAFNIHQCSFKLKTHKMNCARGFFYNQGVVQSFTMEISNLGYDVEENNKPTLKYFGQNRSALSTFGDTVLTQSINRMIERIIRY